ncbi:MAG: hypothetical protein AB1486_26040 [Planctomycetota bacterium]
MTRRLLWSFLGTLTGVLVACSGDSGDSPGRGEPLPEDGGTPPPPNLEDADADGLPNYLEIRIGSDPLDSHDPFRYGHLDPTNYWGPGGDGVTDGLERYLVSGGASAPVTVYSETDGDGVPDYFEVAYGPSPFDVSDPVQNGGRDRDDANGPTGDGITDALETLLVENGAQRPVTKWTSTDGDESPDYIEVFLGTDPFDPTDYPSLADDPDGDGLPTYLEIRLGWEPFNGDDPFAGGASDRDGDTIRNGLEDYLTQLSGGAPDSIDYPTDSDADGIPDVHEVLWVPSAPDDPDDPIEGGGLDSDDDLIANGLEGYLAAVGGHPGEDVTPSTDSDGDGLPGVLEVVLPQGVPYSPDQPYKKGKLDNDGDTVPNAVERYLENLEGTPRIIIPVTATSDSDCDGRADASEVRRGFDPQAIDLERYAAEILPNVIRFNWNGQLENNRGVRYVVVRVLTVQHPSEPGIVNLHEIRLRDSSGALIPVEGMRIAGATPSGADRRLRAVAAPEPPSHRNPPQNLFDGVLIDQRNPDPTRWVARDSFQGEGMYTALDLPPYVYVLIDLGAEYDLQDMLIWNGLQSPGRTPEKIAVALLPPALEVVPEGGPGGIEPANGEGSLSFWVRADLGPSTTVDGSRVDEWSDQSGYGRHALAGATTGPIYRTTSPARGRPVIQFNRDDMTVPRPVTDDFSIFTIAATTRSDAGNWWETDGSFLGHEVVGCSGDMGLGFLDKRFFWAVCGVHLSFRTVNDGAAHVLTLTRNIAKKEAKMLIDGALDQTVDPESQPLTSSEVWGFGQVLNGGRLIGEMWEMLAYTRPLGETERNIVDNYFAAKYGIAISGDYYPYDATHGNRLGGIGHTDATDYVGRARSIDFLEIDTPSALSNGDRLFWGSDHSDPYAISYDVPEGYARRVGRTWAFQETDGGGGNGVGTVNVRFYLGHINASPQSSDYALLTDVDTRFGDATVKSATYVVDPDQQSVTFPGVRLGTAGTMTLAISDL